MKFDELMEQSVVSNKSGKSVKSSKSMKSVKSTKTNKSRSKGKKGKGEFVISFAGPAQSAPPPPTVN